MIHPPSDESDALVPVAPAAPAIPLSTNLVALVQQAARFANADRTTSTKRAYARQFRQFEAWCRSTGLPALPSTSEVVTTYVAALATAGRRISTIEQSIAAIAYAHEQANVPWDKSPVELRKTRKGLRRELLVAKNQKSPIEDDHLRKLIATCDDGLIGLRDRALLLVCWCGAFRRAEVVSLDVGDVTFDEEGLRVVLRRSKTDQEGLGFEKGLANSSDPALCPGRSLRRWLDAAQIVDGALFRSLGRGLRLGARLSDQAVALLVKARMAKAGYDPRGFSGHSLRSGFVTTAAKMDKPLDEIMRQTGHKNESTLLGYIRHATVFKKNASKGLL
jgi:integrase